MRKLTFLLGVLLIASAATAGQKVGEGPYDMSPLVLDDYTPPPRIVARSDSLQALIAAAKPTAVFHGEMLWIEHDKQGRLALTFGSPERVRLGTGPAFWALLRPGKPGHMERTLDFATTEILNASTRDLPLEQQKPQHDSGAGDYARLILRGAGTDLYELGVQSDWLGSAHPVEERRLYVLHGPGDVWRFVGEGPAETSERGHWMASVAKATLTGKLDTPVIIEFTTTSQTTWTTQQPEEDAAPDYPEVEVRRKAMLAGPLPAKLQWLTDPYVIADQPGDTLDAIIRRYIYWEIEGGSKELAKDESYLAQAAACRQLAEESNPALTHVALAPGTIVHLPTTEQVQDLLAKMKR